MPRKQTDAQFSLLAVGFDEPADAMADFVADAAEDAHLLFVVALRLCGVIETPVELMGCAGEIRARFARVVANRDHIIELLLRKRVHGFGFVFGDVDTGFTHSPDGEWMDVTRRFRARAEDLEPIARERTQETFRHVAAAGIARAQK